VLLVCHWVEHGSTTNFGTASNVLVYSTLEMDYSDNYKVDYSNYNVHWQQFCCLLSFVYVICCTQVPLLFDWCNRSIIVNCFVTKLSCMHTEIAGLLNRGAFTHTKLLSCFGQPLANK